MSENQLIWKIVKLIAVVVIFMGGAFSVNKYVKTQAALKAQTIQMETMRQVEEIEQGAKTARTQERTDKWTHTFQKAVPWGQYDDEVNEDAE